MHVLIIQVKLIVKISWIIFISNQNSCGLLLLLLFFTMSFEFHSKLKFMAELQGPSLRFLDIGPIVLLCHEAEQSQ